MLDFFDRNDTRPWKSREASLFRDFKAIISIARTHAAAIRKNTRNVDVKSVKRLEDLARIPVIRSAQRTRVNSGDSMFGGLLATNPAYMRLLLLHTAAGQSRDWWKFARALHAAGFAKGDCILSCASYHMTTDGHMIADGALELGCPIVPAGSRNIDRQLEALRDLRPVGYCGKPGVLRRLLDAADERKVDASSMRNALVFGAPLSSQFRREAAARGISVRQCYSLPEAGVVAYETNGPDGAVNPGMVVNEGIIVEILNPETDAPVKAGEVGEIVVTRLNTEFPLLRFATGDLSRIIPGPSPCGRTNMRIQGWMGRVEEQTLLGNKTLCPSLVLEMSARLACVGKMRLVVSNKTKQDEAVLRVEGPENDPQLPINLRATMKSVLGFEAGIDIVSPGALPDDGKLISDERARA